jgi:EpsI family protein
MTRPSIAINSLILALMLLAAGLAWAFTPTTFLADTLPPLHLKEIIPTQFSEWEELPSGQGQIVDPSSQTLIDTIYTETLSRSYINRQGYRIMLSIAYGRDQRDSLQLHHPEACYPAQGFQLLSKERTELLLSTRTIAGTRLTTRLGPRYEPVTYWTMVGTKVFRGGISKKMAEMDYARHGYIPDGLLFRVSSIDSDSPRAFEEQQRFASDLITAIPETLAPRFAGLAPLKTAP